MISVTRLAILSYFSLILGVSECQAADAVSEKLDAFENVINKNLSVRYDISSFDMSKTPEIKIGDVKYYRANSREAGEFSHDDPKRHRLALYYSMADHPFGFFALGDYANGVVYFPKLGVAVPIQQKDNALLNGVTNLTGGVSPLDIKAILSLTAKSELRPAKNNSYRLKCGAADTCAELQLDVTKLREKKLLPNDIQSMKLIIFFTDEPDLLSVFIVVNDLPFSRTEFSRTKVDEKELNAKVFNLDLSAYELVPMPLAEALAKTFAAEQNKLKVRDYDK